MAAVITRGKVTRADLALWDGKTATATRVDATGGTVTGLAIGNEVDVLQVYGGGTSRTRATIAAAIQAIGSTACTLVFAPGTWAIDDNLTIPGNFTCYVPNGAVFDVASGKTLTFARQVLLHYPLAWTSGAGTVTIPKGIAGAWYPLSVAESAAGLTYAEVTQPQHEYGNVLRYGAVADDATDCATAFNNAWQAIKETGGILIVPPGDYYLDATWLLDVDLTAPRNYAIYAYGATIRSGPNVTGFAVQVYKGYNYGGVTIRGLRINHRDNATAAGGIQLKGALSAHLQDVDIEMHSNAATWTGFELAASTPGNGDTHSFWTVLDQCSTRKRAGADGGVGVYSYCGINLKGQANATVIRACRLNSVTHAIRMETDGVVDGHANGVVVRDNAIEGCTNGITVNTAAPATLMPAGLRITGNRVESVTNWLNITGAAVTDHSNPPILRDNYLAAGSITTPIVNANNQRIFVDEPLYYGITDVDNRVGGPNNYRIVCHDTGKNLIVENNSGNSNYSNAHLVLGAYHLWVEVATGKLRIKSGAPSADNDGTVVGTQS